MKETQPLVTVYIPTHNRRNLLERALNSIVNQTYTNLEIIVVDDGSTDDTERFMQEFMIEYPKVKYLKHDTPKGANAARNYAIKEAQGYFVTGLDDDDEMLPMRIKKMVEAYNNEYAYVFTGSYIIQENKIIEHKIKKNIITLSDMLYVNITSNQVLSTKKMFLDADLFDEELVSAQDYDMWLRMLKIKNKAKAIQEPLSNIYDVNHYRITNSRKQMKGYLQCYIKHKNSMTREHRKVRLSEFRHIKKKRISAWRMIALYPIKKWPRLYAGFMKRKTISSFHNIVKK